MSLCDSINNIQSSYMSGMRYDIRQAGSTTAQNIIPEKHLNHK